MRISIGVGKLRPLRCLVVCFPLCGLAGCLVSYDSSSPVAAPSQTAPSANAARNTEDTEEPAALPSSDGEKSIISSQAAEAPEVAQAQVKPAANHVAADSKVREALFKDWPKPKVAFVLSGQQHGYIEPCGCTGLANQKGGLARRHTFLKQLNEQGWELAPFDVGNQVRRFGRQPEIQFQMTVEGLRKMKYKAVALGPDDLRLSEGELVAVLANEDSPFVCANAAVLDRDLTARFRVLEVGGVKVGITAVVGSDELKLIPAGAVIKEPPLDGLAVAWPKLKAEKCDVYVLLAHASLGESKIIATKFPEFDIVVSAGGKGEPTLEPEKIPGSKGVLLQVGTKGMYVGVVGLFDGPSPKLRYQRVPLDDRYTDSKDMLALLASYQEQLKTAGLDGLGVKPLPHPAGRKFVGSAACGDCHTKAFEVWKNTTHATATESLVHPGERSEIARHFDPECLSCHVTGWNAQKYFPYKSGYLSLDDKPLHGNGCENCHGPGGAHVAAEMSKTAAATLKMLRAEMRLPLAEAEKRCMDCHDLDNSPDFHVKGAFEKYWKEIEHKGLD